MSKTYDKLPIEIHYERVLKDVSPHQELYAVIITHIDDRIPYLLNDEELNFQHYKMFDFKFGGDGAFNGRKLYVTCGSNNYIIVCKWVLDMIIDRIKLINEKYK